MENLLSHPEPTAGSQIALTEVCYNVDGKAILYDLSLNTRDARIAILGRNGSGKSTLARIIAGLIAPTSGTALVNGHNLSKNRKAALAEVGILFQNPDHQIIFPTVQEEIAFGLRQLGQSKDQADAVTRATLGTFGKDHWYDAHVTSLSQGQKQLLCLMAVVTMAPKMIILDEPLSGLDIPTKAQLRQYFDRFRGGIVHITHTPDDVQGYDLAVWLEKGALVAADSADLILPKYHAHMQTLGATDDISDIAS